MASLEPTSEDELYTSWLRVARTTQTAFPDESETGDPPFRDLDNSAIFIGSALIESSVHPCKVGPDLKVSCVSVAYKGTEYLHHGRYDLLPFSEQDMEWITTSHGRIPKGRRPVLGGYDEDNKKFKLYHATAYIDNAYGSTINQIKVPGKAGEHLGGSRISFAGKEHKISQNYDLLCWRQ